MKIIAIIQARMESTRLPKKVLMNICERPILDHIVERVKQSKYIEKVVIATSTNEADNEINEFARSDKIDCFRGSQENILERFYLCSQKYMPQIVIRLTGDNALVDAEIIDEGIEKFIKEEVDYLYYREGLPLGMCIEIFTYSALEKAYEEAKDAECLEHVTPYLYKNKKFKSMRASISGVDYSWLRWTVDEKEDLELVTKIYEYLYPLNPNFNFNDILNAYKANPDWISINQNNKQKQLSYTGN